MKRFTNKNLKGSCGTVSTATMTNEQYIAAIEGGVLTHWADEELMRKTGINNLFADNIKVKNTLSYEDACDCLNRVLKMVEMATYVGAQFHKRSNEIDEQNADAYTKYLQDLSVGKTSGKFVVENDFYSADTLRDLFIEAKEKVAMVDGDAPNDLASAIEKLNSSISALSSIKKIVFMNAIVSAHVANAEMTGFRN